jgi:predicted O-linked N-acetylglucosamine transferase (SPINDLY family)
MIAIQKAVEHYHAGRLDQAIAALRRAVRQAPKHPDANHLLGMALMTQGDLKQAEHYTTRAVALAPNHPDYLNTLGLIRYRHRQYEEAVGLFERSIAAHPTWPAPRNNLANALMDLKRIPEAAATWDEALRVDPGHADSLQSYAMLLRQAGRSDLAVPMLRRAAELDPSSILAAGNLAVALNYVGRDGGGTPEEVKAAHVALCRVMAQTYPAQPLTHSKVDRSPERRLTLGFLSPDLRAHSVSLFLEPLLRGLDRSERGFSVNLYSCSPRHDETTDRLRALADRFHDVGPMADDGAARLIQGHKVDVLVELAGHTENSRLRLLAHRPAPVQVNYLGYPSTTGHPGADYRLVDAFTDPPGSEGHCTEKLERIERCFLVYAPPVLDGPPPEPGPPPSASGAPVTFGSFNLIMKVSPATARLWGRVLSAVPGSRLLIKSFGVDDRWARLKFLSQFESAGVAPQRVEMLAYAPSRAEHLRLYNRVDVALDPFPYNGTTTTCEALWMGVPVVTLEGTAHVSRVGVSLLTAVGLPELVARDEDEYVAKASALALDVSQRGRLRRGLRERLMASPLGDAGDAGRRFGAAVRRIWAEFCVFEHSRT